MILRHGEKQYNVIKELGQGHSGLVYLATNSQKKEVAVKCLVRNVNDRTVERFRREFSTLRSLVHPNIAQPLDFGLDETSGRYFFVTEYVRGSNLEEALFRADPKTAFDYFAQALKALDYLHRQGIFHCDLKPQNILVNGEGRLKIIDFDVATRGGGVLGGTSVYFPPELLNDLKKNPDAGSDLFSLGATFYHCLTGVKPYPGKTLQEIRESHRSLVPALPSGLNPKLHSAWDGLLSGLIQVNPSRRFRTASSVLQQVLPLTGERANLLSAEEIEYRLSQHGLPVGKDEILTKARSFLEHDWEKAPSEERVWLLSGDPGGGTSYLLEELRILAQMKGLKTYVWNSSQREEPRSFPFVWMIDDFSGLLQGKGEGLSRVVSRLKDLLHRGSEQNGWLVIGGMEEEGLPPGLLPVQPAQRWSLSSWKEKETRTWLKDVFQVQEIPPFLVKRLQNQGKGNPRKNVLLLKRFLEKGLLLNSHGHWRKDLFHPTSLFSEAFLKISSAEEENPWFEKLKSWEQKMLFLLSAAHEGVPEASLEGLLKRKAIHSTLLRFLGLKVLDRDEEGRYSLGRSDLKNWLQKRLGEKKLRRLHDEWAREVKEETEALLYHEAHGSHARRSASAWASFGDADARRGLWQSAEEHYERALAKLKPSDSETRLEYAIQRGKCLVGKNELGKAREFFQSLLREFSGRVKSAPRSLTKIYERLGVIETKRGHLGKAREYFEKGIGLLGPAREPLEHYLALRNFLAGLDLAEGKVKEAIAAFRESHEKAQRELPWERRRILTNNDLGAALLKAGLFEEAVAHWTQSLEDLRRREDKTPLIRCYYQMAQAHLERGFPKEASNYFLQAEEASAVTQNFEMDLRILNALANLLRDEDPPKALQMFERALTAAFQTPDLFSTAAILFNMGFLLSERGEAARAIHALRQGLTYLSQCPASKESTALLHSAHLELSKTHAQIFKDEEALQHAREALALVEGNENLERARFETLLLYWQALVLGRKNERAQELRKTLDCLAIDSGKRAALQDQELKNQELMAAKELSKGQALSGMRSLVHDSPTETTLISSLEVPEKEEP